MCRKFTFFNKSEFVFLSLSMSLRSGDSPEDVLRGTLKFEGTPRGPPGSLIWGLPCPPSTSLIELSERLERRRVKAVTATGCTGPVGVPGPLKRPTLGPGESDCFRS